MCEGNSTRSSKMEIPSQPHESTNINQRIFHVPRSPTPTQKKKVSHLSPVKEPSPGELDKERSQRSYAATQRPGSFLESSGLSDVSKSLKRLMIISRLLTKLNRHANDKNTTLTYYHLDLKAQSKKNTSKNI